ncbi:hypothetical protein [Sphingobacterium tabacisoli]|uniref:Histidine kinase n=1 Tax=Sphingobacterium tabacisoli TaxID=2044855 RepID=A0ABW5L6A1_9SPHI|nr:hypothetical protein [Sphingobacterium tabacisoli]
MMDALVFALKYVVRIFIIAYLLTTNWRFLHIKDYLNAPKFWPLYWATCVAVLIYMGIIEMLYCVLVLNHSRRTGGTPRLKRKIVFFVMGITIVTAINLTFLHFIFSTARHSFISAGYWESGFVFFLLLFIAYEVWIWYRPRTTLGFWVMERWVAKVVQGIEQKASPSSVICTEEVALVDTDIALSDEIQTEIFTKKGFAQIFIGEVSILLMDILLIISQRDGVSIYVRSGRCFFIEAKLAQLFNEGQLAWFTEYRKGARVGLAHLVSAVDEDGLLGLDKHSLKVFREVWEKSALELDSLLTVSPVYIDRIEQQIENKEQLGKAVLSQSIQLKSVIENY